MSNDRSTRPSVSITIGRTGIGPPGRVQLDSCALYATGRLLKEEPWRSRARSSCRPRRRKCGRRSPIRTASRSGSRTTSSSMRGPEGAACSAGTTARPGARRRRARARGALRLRLDGRRRRRVSSRSHWRRQSRGRVSASSRRRRRSRASGPWGSSAGARGRRRAVSDPGRVFAALADPHRRFLVEALAAREAQHRQARLRAAGDEAGGLEASRRTRGRGPGRAFARRPRDPLPPHAGPARRGDGLDRARRQRVGRPAGSTGPPPRTLIEKRPGSEPGHARPGRDRGQTLT